MMGDEVKNRYIEKEKLLDVSKYRPKQMYVRATDINRTIESAMSQLTAIYFTGHSLQINQTTEALPRIQVPQSEVD